MVNYWEFMTVLTFQIHQWLQWNHLQTYVHFKLFAYEPFIYALSWEITVAAGTAGAQSVPGSISLHQLLIWQIYLVVQQAFSPSS